MTADRLKHASNAEEGSTLSAGKQDLGTLPLDANSHYPLIAKCHFHTGLHSTVPRINLRRSSSRCNCHSNPASEMNCLACYPHTLADLTNNYRLPFYLRIPITASESAYCTRMSHLQLCLWCLNCSEAFTALHLCGANKKIAAIALDFPKSLFDDTQNSTGCSRDLTYARFE